MFIIQEVIEGCPQVPRLFSVAWQAGDTFNHMIQDQETKIIEDSTTGDILLRYASDESDTWELYMWEVEAVYGC